MEFHWAGIIFMSKAKLLIICFALCNETWLPTLHLLELEEG